MSNRWLIYAAAFVALQFAFCLSVATAHGFNAPPPFIKYSTIATGVFLVTLAARVVWTLRTMPSNPVKHLRDADWSDIPGFCCAMILIWLQFVGLTWAKSMIPAVTPMWADIPLANMERMVLGRDAWEFLPGPTVWLESIYINWAPTVCAMYVAIYFSKRKNRETSLLALFVTVGILGTVGQYALPSGGPIFFERLGFGDRFAGIELQERTRFISAMLWNAYEGKYVSIATGISAFPSIHVAASAWIACAFRHWLAYLHLAVIFVASIILGWHYALDGLAGAIGAVLCYALAGTVLRWHGEQQFTRLAFRANRGFGE